MIHSIVPWHTLMVCADRMSPRSQQQCEGSCRWAVCKASLPAEPDKVPAAVDPFTTALYCMTGSRAVPLESSPAAS